VARYGGRETRDQGRPWRGVGLSSSVERRTEKEKREEGDDRRDPLGRERRRENAGGLPPSWAGA